MGLLRWYIYGDYGTSIDFPSQHDCLLQRNCPPARFRELHHYERLPCAAESRSLQCSSDSNQRHAPRWHFRTMATDCPHFDLREIRSRTRGHALHLRTGSSHRRLAGREARNQNPQHHLHHPWPRRSLLQRTIPNHTLPRRLGRVDAVVHRSHGEPGHRAQTFLARDVPRPDRRRLFSLDIPVKALEDNKFVLEGHTFEAVDVGHSDTDNTTFLHVPALDMAVAGDIVYNGVHLWMYESPTEASRDAWIKSLDQLEAYNAGVVVGAHHVLGGVDGAFNIEATRDYIRTFGEMVKKSSNANELYERMLSAYPDREGFAVLWLSCSAQYPEATS